MLSSGQSPRRRRDPGAARGAPRGRECRSRRRGTGGRRGGSAASRWCGGRGVGGLACCRWTRSATRRRSCWPWSIRWWPAGFVAVGRAQGWVPAAVLDQALRTHTRLIEQQAPAGGTPWRLAAEETAMVEALVTQRRWCAARQRQGGVGEDVGVTGRAVGDASRTSPRWSTTSSPPSPGRPGGSHPQPATSRPTSPTINSARRSSATPPASANAKAL